AGCRRPGRRWPPAYRPRRRPTPRTSRRGPCTRRAAGRPRRGARRPSRETCAATCGSAADETLGEVPRDLVDRDALLLHGVALADRDGVVLEGVEVDRDA